ncbi:hypothetical protein C5O72_08155 [Muribaculum intestinale]|uniref:hypothetical protein n=1 Tax=Muribaculum intestinale TaxID=1796646 RepID=UPI000D13F5FC|nr:hypothetical protein [Muribaculum intestinale]PWB10223.1 hypothetical protein C5O72_08155 [Muribaculum intestinale]
MKVGIMVESNQEFNKIAPINFIAEVLCNVDSYNDLHFSQKRHLKEYGYTEETVEQVMELRDCDKDEARRFIALGMFLGCTFGDLDESFEADANWPNQYSAFGTDYLVGTDDELTDAARNYIFDEGCYDDLWRQAVQAQQTELGLEDWLNDVLDNDGWCNILNHYDGKYEEYTVGKDIICVSRT